MFGASVGPKSRLALGGPPVRLLWVIGAPPISTASSAVGLDRACERLLAAVTDLEMAGRLEMELFIAPTAQTLRLALDEAGWDVIHFSGWFAADAATGHGGLSLTGVNGDPECLPVTALLNAVIPRPRPLELASGLPAPRCAGRLESACSRIRRRIRCAHPAAQRFFYPGPVFAFPLLNAGLITFQRPTFRLLAAEAKVVQQAGHVTAVVLNTATPVNNRCHPARGPQLRAKAVDHRSLHQFLDDPLSLRSAQRWRSAWRRANLQRLIAAALPRIAPAHHRTGGTVGQPADLAQRVTLIQQSQRLAAPCFDQLCRSPRSRHDIAPQRYVRPLLHYL